MDMHISPSKELEISRVLVSMLAKMNNIADNLSLLAIANNKNKK